MRQHRRYVTDPGTIRELDGLEADLVRAKQQHTDRPSDIMSVRQHADRIARAYEEDAAAESGADAPSGLYKNLGVPWSQVQGQLRAGAAALSEIIADVDDWLANR